MSQRNYANDRNRKDGKTGHTRKSAAAAKPVRKQGSIDTTKPDKPKAKSGPEKDWAGLPTSPEIKKWRRIWWALLLTALALAAANILLEEVRTNDTVMMVSTALVFVLSMAAVTIDLTVIRKLRNDLIAKTTTKKKSSKHDASKEAATGTGKKDAS